METTNAINETTVETTVEATKKARMAVTWLNDTITLKLVGLAGQSMEFAGDCLELPETVYVSCRSAKHGIEQKLRDNLAMSKDVKAITTSKELFDKTEKLWNSLKTNEWNLKGTGAAEKITVSDIELQFIKAIKSGEQEYAAASALYTMITKKQFTKTEEEIDEMPNFED
jgi:hypothetical protein